MPQSGLVASILALIVHIFPWQFAFYLKLFQLYIFHLSPLMFPFNMLHIISVEQVLQAYQG